MRPLGVRLFAVVVIAFVTIASPALAQSVADVVEELDDGLYVADGLDADTGELLASVEFARNAGLGLSVVLLDDDPPGGATTFADSVLSDLGEGTVLVLSAGTEGMASTEIDQETIERALDAGFAAGGGDGGYVAEVVSVLTRTSPADDGDSGEDGGGTGLWVVLIVVVGLVAGVWWLMRRSRKASERRRSDVVGEARAEIKGQLDSMANTILEITDIVEASEAQQDDTHLEQAGATYMAALEAYESAADLASLEELSDRLDEARWRLDAALAIAEGRDAPPKPETRERPVCFFDPTHRDATEMVDIRTATGTRTVRVCRADAERIRRGDQPQPRMIEVEGERVPAPVAPRSHGGGGMDWLETFSVAAGSAGQAMSYDWGRERGRPASRSRARGGTQKAGGTQKRSRAGRTRRRRR